jgi:hypothetical protein
MLAVVVAELMLDRVDLLVLVEAPVVMLQQQEALELHLLEVEVEVAVLALHLALQVALAELVCAYYLCQQLDFLMYIQVLTWS